MTKYHTSFTMTHDSNPIHVLTHFDLIIIDENYPHNSHPRNNYIFLFPLKKPFSNIVSVEIPYHQTLKVYDLLHQGSNYVRTQLKCSFAYGFVQFHNSALRGERS